MSDAPVDKAIEDLRVAAREFSDAVSKVNQLPDNFPTELVTALVEQVSEIEGADDDSVRIAMHLRDKILQTIDAYKDGGDEASASSFLRTLHNGFFVEISRFLTTTSAADRFPDLADSRRPRPFVRSSELREERENALAAATNALNEAKHAHVTVQNFVQQNGLVNIGSINFSDIELSIVRAKKAIAGLSLELASSLVDLRWVSEFIRLATKCGEHIASIVRRMDRTLRSSAVVAAIESFLDKAVTLAAQVNTFVARGDSQLDTAVISGNQARTNEVMGVKIGDRFRALTVYRGDPAGLHVVWIVEEISELPDGIWHARLGANIFGTKERKTISVGELN